MDTLSLTIGNARCFALQGWSLLSSDQEARASRVPCSALRQIPQSNPNHFLPLVGRDSAGASTFSSFFLFALSAFARLRRRALRFWEIKE